MLKRLTLTIALITINPANAYEVIDQSDVSSEIGTVLAVAESTLTVYDSNIKVQFRSIKSGKIQGSVCGELRIIRKGKYFPFDPFLYVGNKPVEYKTGVKIHKIEKRNLLMLDKATYASVKVVALRNKLGCNAPQP